jgi:hypothetical protein
MNNTPKNGDIFRFKILKNEFGFGRVLLNINELIEGKKLIDIDHPFRIFKGSSTILAEFYKETTSGVLPKNRTILIPSIYTSYGFITLGLWDIVGNEKILPNKVDFPESLVSKSPVITSFTKGEIELPFKLEMTEVDSIGIPLRTFPPTIFDNIMLYHLGRKDEITNPAITDKEVLNTTKSDLRFSEHRVKIYHQLADYDPKESYYDFSKRMGFDLARFYD